MSPRIYIDLNGGEKGKNIIHIVIQPEESGKEYSSKHFPPSLSESFKISGCAGSWKHNASMKPDTEQNMKMKKVQEGYLNFGCWSTMTLILLPSHMDLIPLPCFAVQPEMQNMSIGGKDWCKTASHNSCEHFHKMTKWTSGQVWARAFFSK